MQPNDGSPQLRANQRVKVPPAQSEFTTSLIFKEGELKYIQALKSSQDSILSPNHQFESSE